MFTATQKNIEKNLIFFHNLMTIIDWYLWIGYKSLTTNKNNSQIFHNKQQTNNEVNNNFLCKFISQN